MMLQTTGFGDPSVVVGWHFVIERKRECCDDDDDDNDSNDVMWCECRMRRVIGGRMAAAALPT
jgi:hypothetical protein